MATPVQPNIFYQNGQADTIGGSFNNRDFRAFGLVVSSLNTDAMPPVRTRRIPRAGAHGQYIFPEYYDAKSLMLSGRMIANGPAELRTNIDALKTFLNSFRRDMAQRLRLIDPARPDRFYTCYFAGPATFVEIGPRLVARMVDVSIGLTAEPPFAQAIDLSEVSYTPVADDFYTFETGTFESEPHIIIQGGVTDPKLIVGDSIFIAPFNRTTDCTDINNTAQAGTFSGTGTEESALFSPSKIGLGYAFNATGNDTLTWPIKANKTAGSWFAIVEPNFDATDAGAKTIFQLWKDTTASLSLVYYNDVNADLQRRWALYMATSLESVLKPLASQTFESFVAGTVFKIGFSYGPTYGLRLFINGVKNAQKEMIGTLTANPTTIGLHAHGENFTANSKIHYLAGWASELTDNEHALIASDPATHIQNRNQVLSYTGTLNTGEVLDFDRRDGQYEGHLYAADGSATPVFPDNGTVIPTLASENTAVYHANAIPGGVTIQYRKRYL